jgi:hypothetical protein
VPARGSASTIRAGIQEHPRPAPHPVTRLAARATRSAEPLVRRPTPHRERGSGAPAPPGEVAVRSSTAAVRRPGEGAAQMNCQARMRLPGTIPARGLSAAGGCSILVPMPGRRTPTWSHPLGHGPGRAGRAGRDRGAGRPGRRVRPAAHRRPARLQRHSRQAVTGRPAPHPRRHSRRHRWP